MDPFSLIAVLGVTAMTSSALHASSRQRQTRQLHTALGMAVTPATSSSSALPDERPQLPGPVVQRTLWELFEIDNPTVRIEGLQHFTFPDTRERMNAQIERNDAGMTQQQRPSVARWRLQNTSQPLLDEQSLWDLMHRSWLGWRPPLTIDVMGSLDPDSMGAGGAYVAGTIEVAMDIIEADISVVSLDDISAIASMLSGTEGLHDESIEAYYEDCLITALERELPTNDRGTRIEYARVSESLEEESFTATMWSLSDLFEQLETPYQLAGDHVDEVISSAREMCLQAAEREAREEEEERWDDDDDEDDEDDDWS